MTQKSIILFSFVIFVQNSSVLICGLPGAAAPAAGSEILMSWQVPIADVAQFKNLHDTVRSYPIRAVFPDGTIQQGIQNRTIKSMPALKTMPILSKASFSVLRPKKGEFATTYPSGASIFPGYSDLSAKFDAMIAVFQQNPHFVSFFRKVHINVLNQLYHYLMSIYVNFNLQHTGIKQDKSGFLRVDIPAFLKEEEEYASNKKTLIINHFMNLIESQFNSAIRSYVPKLPQVYASYLGKTLVHNDYSIDLTRFLDQSTEAEVVKNKTAYLQGLVTYLDFFQAYTAYLSQPYPQASGSFAAQIPFTAFVDIAEKISSFLKADTALTMNPPLFSFNYDDMRALKMIPHLAKSLPQNSSNIAWPEQIVQAANEGILLQLPDQSPYPIAYFRTSLGTVIKNEKNDISDANLYICMRDGQNLFEEQLIAQPDWLNSWDGVENILRACFGDFSALVGLDILDPCMESLINMVLAVQQGQDISTLQTTSDTCSNLMKAWQKSAIPAVQSSDSLLPGTTDSGLAGLNISTASLPGAGLPGVSAGLPNDASPLPTVGG